MSFLIYDIKCNLFANDKLKSAPGVLQAQPGAGMAKQLML